MPTIELKAQTNLTNYYINTDINSNDLSTIQNNAQEKPFIAVASGNYQFITIVFSN